MSTEPLDILKFRYKDRKKLNFFAEILIFVIFHAGLALALEGGLGRTTDT